MSGHVCEGPSRTRCTSSLARSVQEGWTVVRPELPFYSLTLIFLPSFLLIPQVDFQQQVTQPQPLLGATFPSTVWKQTWHLDTCPLFFPAHLCWHRTEPKATGLQVWRGESSSCLLPPSTSPPHTCQDAGGRDSVAQHGACAWVSFTMCLCMRRGAVCTCVHILCLPVETGGPCGSLPLVVPCHWVYPSVSV